MKYKENDILYYVNPFVFTISKIKISLGVIEHDGIYYIDNDGAYLKEEDLFIDLAEAKGDALKKLNKFYSEKLKEIMKGEQNDTI